MEKIKILSDYGNVYTPNTIIKIADLLKDYKDTVDEEDFVIVSQWDEQKAVEFIADAWGLKIEFLTMENEKENIVENGYRLFGCGDLNPYGDYHLAVADSIENAYKILSKNGYNEWKKDIDICIENSHFDEDGKPLNGSACYKLAYEKEGLFDMNDEELFHYYTTNVFPIDKVTDLKTNIWYGEWA